jgi:hypothetical protein
MVAARSGETATEAGSGENAFRPLWPGMCILVGFRDAYEHIASMMLWWFMSDIALPAFLLYCQLYPQDLALIPRVVNSACRDVTRARRGPECIR